MGPAIPISRTHAFQPVKTVREIVYSPNSKFNKVKFTSLFLVDDFDKIRNGDTLILFTRGCFGFQRQSYADCNNFSSYFSFDTTLLTIDQIYPVADSGWYEVWLKNAPRDYIDPRTTDRYKGLHEDYEFYLGKNKVDD